MAKLVLFNKPFNVLSQFTDNQNRKTLAGYIPIPSVYVAGRLDYDSEGLLLLTDNGKLQHSIASPKKKMPKTYWVEVEGVISTDAIEKLAKGVVLKDGITRPAKAKFMDTPLKLWDRNPPVRFRKNKPTSWLELTISEGKNRQVRRMTAAVGFPTLRLIRYSIGRWNLGDIDQGKYCVESIHMPRK